MNTPKRTHVSLKAELHMNELKSSMGELNVMREVQLIFFLS